MHVDPANVRVHPERNIRAIAESLRRFGQVKPIVVDVDGRILAGNGTYEAAKQAGLDTLTVIRLDGDDASLRAFAIADNRSGELAEWDGAELLASLRLLEGDGWQPAAVGFEPADIADLEAVYGGVPSLEAVAKKYAGADEGAALWPIVSFRAPAPIAKAWIAQAEQDHEGDHAQARLAAALLGIDWPEPA